MAPRLADGGVLSKVLLLWDGQEMNETRYAYLPGTTEPQRTPSLAIINLGLTWKPAEDLNLSFQVDNLLDSDITYIQAYGTLGATSGNNPPIPGARREVSLRFGYRL